MNALLRKLRNIQLRQQLKSKSISCACIDTTSRNILMERLGNHVYLGKDVKFPMGMTEGFIDEYTYMNGGLIYDKVYIGKYCSIGFNVTIAPGMHYTDRISTYPVKIRTLNENWDNVFPPRKKTVIGNDVWIGNNVSIMQGVKIGEGGVIGTGAVVTKDVPPYGIVAGVPAKLIRYRFDDEVISALLKLKWWDWNIEKIQAHKELFLKSGDDLLHEIENLLGEDF